MSQGNTQDENARIYEKFEEEIYKRIQYNTEKLDGAILTLSSGFLALSVTFLKDYSAEHIWLLITSWIVFCLTILSTLASFICSRVGLNVQLELVQEKRTEENKWLRPTQILNIAPSIAFSVAIVLVVVFVSLNLGGDMGKKVLREDGADILRIRQANDDRGADIPPPPRQKEKQPPPPPPPKQKK